VLLLLCFSSSAFAQWNPLNVFADASGKKLFQDDDRKLTPLEVNGEKTYHAEMFSNLWNSTEAFYRLGQHQAGVWNYHGESVELSQANTNISVPLFVSTNGYGIFWNNSSPTTQPDKVADYSGKTLTFTR
jgi:alpha-D-xyloside xylohydrolase